MENLIFLLSESWSSLAADRLFSMFAASATPATDTFGVIFTWARFILATVLVAVLCWFVLRKMAGANRLGRRAGNLSVVESVNLGGQTAVQLIKAGEKYLVVGVTRERVTFLAEVDKDDITEPATSDFVNLNTPFGKVLSRFVKPQNTPGDDENDQ
ncbi:MAG: flagellar biosynthetic protein FliO [Defluviitaleaceae bacterium]|nr:flagellar biosynthetic protein FliO [Defluviitaleaceae bacterium]